MSMYLSGPMTGIPEYNYPAFAEAAAALTDAGYHVVNPADLGQIEGWEWNQYLHRDLAVMLAGTPGTAGGNPLPESVATALLDGGPVDRLALLPGWHNSSGANFEVDVARRLGWAVDAVEHWLAIAELPSADPGTSLGHYTPTHAATLDRPTHG